MPLTNTQIQNAKPQDKPLRMFDERGLYLEIVPAGGRWWRFKYRFAGKEKRISLGVFPDVGLKDARDKRDEARKQVAAGIDPAELRKAAKIAVIEKTENTVVAVAREWFAKYSPSWAYGHSSKIIRRLERDVFPWLGSHPIREVKAPDLLSVLRRIEARGALETALTGSGRFIFPSSRDKDLSMSDNTVLSALRRLGYAKTEMTGHGFRSMASTLLNEQEWNRDAIERQLSHAEPAFYRLSIESVIVTTLLPSHATLQPRIDVRRLVRTPRATLKPLQLFKHFRHLATFIVNTMEETTTHAIHKGHNCATTERLRGNRRKRGKAR